MTMIEVTNFSGISSRHEGLVFSLCPSVENKAPRSEEFVKD